MTSLELGLDGRTAIITGGGQGIGLACVETLHAAGLQVVAADIETADLATYAATRPAIRVLQLDLTAPGAADQLIATAIDQFGTVDVLVNNLADLGQGQPFHEVDDDAWQLSVAVNLLATVRVSRAALTQMTTARSGAIITIGSDAGELPAPEFAPYSITQAALMSLSKLLSKAYGSHGIRSNLIAPGLTRTHATAGLLHELAEKHGDEQTGIAAFTDDLGMALPRIGDAEEVATLVAYLASDLAAQITGAVVRIDGGTVPTI